jgi:hypothetical protein
MRATSSATNSQPSRPTGSEHVSRGRHRFMVLVVSMILAQGAVDVLVSYVSGRRASWLVYFVAASGVWVAILAGLARISAARAREARKDGLAYLQILLISFLCTAAEAVVISLSPLATQARPHQFRWTGSILILVLAVALIMIVAFAFVARYYASEVYTALFLLDILSRLRQPLLPDFGAVGGNISAREIRAAVPPDYPRGEPRGPRPTGLAGDLDRATEWGEGLLTVSSRDRPRTGAPAPVMTAVGFVLLRGGGTELAVIDYFRPRSFVWALLTMPRKTEFAGRTFRVVLRPWLPEEPGGDTAGDGHCWVTFGEDAERYGVVTAKSVVDQPHSTTGSDVSTRASRTKISGTVHAESNTMRATLIELNSRPRPRLIPAPHRKRAGFGLIRLYTGRGPVDGFITGLTNCSLGGFYASDPQAEPAAAALISFNVVGEKGDYGSLVLDIKAEQDGDPAPYLMYLDNVRLGGAQEGLGVLLEQISYHWQINTQFNLQSEYNLINGIIENDEWHMKLSIEAGQTGPRDPDSKR